MEQIYPLHEDVVQQLCGYPVCVVMRDGSRHVGILSSCNGGRLWLNGDHTHNGPEVTLTKVQPKDMKKKKDKKLNKEANHKSEQAITQAYPYDPNYQPYNPWGGAFFLDFALIALLFLLI